VNKLQACGKPVKTQTDYKGDERASSMWRATQPPAAPLSHQAPLPRCLALVGAERGCPAPAAASPQMESRGHAPLA
jgi:hypothetical protein